MMTLFTIDMQTNEGIKTYPSMSYVARTYRKEVDKVIDYYNHRPFYLNRHVITRVINLLSTDVRLNDELYREMIKEKSRTRLKTFRFTTSIDVGTSFNGVFFDDALEYITLLDHEDDYSNIGSDWRKLTPVRMLRHSYTDMGLHIPLPGNYVAKKDIVVVSMDIVTLMMMYKYWRKEQRELNVDGNSLNASHFVHSYVLPAMLPSFVNIAIFNRLQSMLFNTIMDKSVGRLPFHVSDYTSRLDSVLIDILIDNDNTSFDYSRYINSVRTIDDTPLLPELRLPSFIPNKQLLWLMYISRSSIMIFLLKWGGAKGKRRNAVYIKTMTIFIKRLLRDNVYSDKDPSLMREIQQLNELILK